MARKKKRHLIKQKPWSPEEDKTLAEITQVRLDSHFWYLALPGRAFAEIVQRRYELDIKPGRVL